MNVLHEKINGVQLDSISKYKVGNELYEYPNLFC